MVDHKLALYSIIESIIKSDDTNTSEWTPESITAFANLLSSHIKITATDLESFAKHARRSTVTPDDVKLLCRRNESLEKNLTEYIAANLKKEKE